MNENKWGMVLFAAVLAIGTGVYYFNPPKTPSATIAETPPAEAPVAAPSSPPPAPDYPVPEPTPDAPPLPALADSDAAMRADLSALIGAGSFEAFLVPDMLIRRIVVTIDNLPRERVASNLRPIKRTPLPTAVRQDGGRVLLAPENSERYGAQVSLFTAIDAAQFVSLYFRWYARFQSAYVDLGYPGRSFNNRLVEVLDHLLATPDAPAEIELIRPKVAYEFADPKLEALSAGQKTLLRLNAEQRAQVMKQLRAIRAAVVAHSPGAAAR